MSVAHALTTLDRDARPGRPIAQPKPTGRAPEWNDHALLSAAIAKPVRWGYVVVLAFVAGLGGWAATAPLAGGAMAPGVISPEGSRKVVQHLEGGIVEELRVRDGDVVEAGQPLLVLANVQPKANFDMLADEHLGLLAKMARLEAEKAGRDTMVLVPELTGSGAAVRSLVQHQADMLRTRAERYSARQRVLNQKIAQLVEQIQGYQAQVTSTTQQLSLIAEEVGAKDHLLARGYLAKPEALRLKRAQAEIVGRQGELRFSIARTQQQIGETKLELLSLEAERADQIAAEMDKVRNDHAKVLERLRASADILKRTVITAPVAGSVVNMKFKSMGSIVQRAETIMEIVPSRDKLVVEAKVSPSDIDIVHGGLTAQIHFTAYPSRNAPRISGTIVSVSADRLMESGNQRGYYLAKVEVNSEELARLAPNVVLIPGMPADVLIVTEERTMLDMFLQPFRDAMRRSFREV